MSVILYYSFYLLYPPSLILSETFQDPSEAFQGLSDTSGTFLRPTVIPNIFTLYPLGPSQLFYTLLQSAYSISRHSFVLVFGPLSGNNGHLPL